jgi:hypothetical protein
LVGRGSRKSLNGMRSASFRFGISRPYAKPPAEPGVRSEHGSAVNSRSCTFQHWDINILGDMFQPFGSLALLELLSHPATFVLPSASQQS